MFLIDTVFLGVVPINPTIFMAFLSILVGILGGLGALLLGYLIDLVSFISFSQIKDLPVPLLGGTGGLLVGLLTFFLAQEARGRGIPEVIKAVDQHGGRIRPRVALVKTLASALTIGTGGSAGREGPIAQIGATLGSTVGQLLKLSEEQVVTLLACGAGAGIAATFNAPIAGTIFALEVILRRFSIKLFSLVAISAVTGTLTSYLFLGNEPTFSVGSYSLISPVELLLYACLGIAAAFVAQLFLRVFNRTEELFKKMTKVPVWLLPALGGVAFGLIGCFLPETLGRGEKVMEQILCGQLNAAGFLALLCLAKIITTSLTLGSGGSGGTLFPSMFIGACLGGSFGSVAHSLMPGLVEGSGAYAIVGMGALFAAANKAPVTAIIMVLEMTCNQHLTLPLMFACGISSILVRTVEKESIHTMHFASH